MTSAFTSAVCLVLCILLSGASQAGAAQPEDGDPAEALSAWAARTEATQSLHVRISSVRIAKPPGPGQADAELETARESAELWFRGDELAVEMYRDQQNSPWDPPRMRQVVNSLGRQWLNSSRSSGTEFDETASGVIDFRKKQPHAVLELVYLPLLVGYRGEGAMAFRGFDAGNTVLKQGKDNQIDGVNCAVVSSTVEGPTVVRREVWVDPDRDFLPLRILEFADEMPFFQIDITYSPHETAGYAPASWKCTIMNVNGELSATETVTVEEFDTTTPMSDDTFRMDYPPGSTVGVWGEEARITVGPDGFDIKQLLPATEAPARPSVLTWCVIAAGVIAAAVLARRLSGGPRRMTPT